MNSPKVSLPVPPAIAPQWAPLRGQSASPPLTERELAETERQARGEPLAVPKYRVVIPVGRPIGQMKGSMRYSISDENKKRKK